MQIHIVDDDLTVLDATKFLLEQVGYGVTTWSNSQEFIENVALYEEGILLLDMKMPGLDGKQVHQFLSQQNSTLAVIILTGHGDIPMAVHELKQGAVDFLQKPVQFTPLQTALALAWEKTEKNYQRYQIHCCYAKLSSKELDILNLLIQGYINRQIAETLNISIRTVEVHRSHLMEKMQAHTIAELLYKISQL